MVRGMLQTSLRLSSEKSAPRNGVLFEKLHCPFNCYRQVLMDFNMIENISLVLTDEPPALYPGLDKHCIQGWTNIVLYDDKSPLGKYGYSHDHRPDKK